MQVARSGLVFGHFWIRMTWKHLQHVWWSDMATFVEYCRVGQPAKPDYLYCWYFSLDVGSYNNVD